MKAFLFALALLVVAALLVAADTPRNNDLRSTVANQVDVVEFDQLQEMKQKAESLAGEYLLLKFQLEKCLRELKQKEAAKASRGKFPRLIMFSAPEWCAPCRELEKNIEKLAGQAYQVDGKLHLWKENIGGDETFSIQLVDCSDSDGDGSKLAGDYGVSTFPTTLRVTGPGTVESWFTGVIDADTICRYQAGKWSPPVKLDPKKFVGGPK